MKKLATMFCTMLAAGLLAGCAGLRYGDGKIGTVPLSPAVEAVATAADAKKPGSGKIIRDYFATSQQQRVPPGYEIVIDSYLDGKLIDPSKIIPVPRLQAKSGDAPVVIVAPAPPTNAPALPGEVLDVLNQIATNQPAAEAATK